MSAALEYAIPEILWHGGGNEGGKPDPVFSVDMHPEGVLATAGVDEMVPPKGTVRLWRNNVDTIIEADKQQHWDNFMCDLSDHPRGSVNVCRFSPNGLMLASASEAQVVIYKVKNATDWKVLDEDTKKTKLERIWLRPGLEEIRDLEWSPDSSYIVIASIDNKGEILRVDSKDRGSLGLRGHTNYVQGVAWDPLNAMVLTQSADRSIRTYKIKVKNPVTMLKLAPSGGNHGANPQVAKMHGGYEAPEGVEIEKRELTAADFGVEEEGTDATGVAVKDSDGKKEKKGKKEKAKNLFADSTVPSFFRRPTFTPDGNLVIAPTGIHRPIPIPESLKGRSTEEGVEETPDKTRSRPEAGESKGKFCTHIFSRYDLTTPVMSLTGLEEPSVAVRCSPVLYKLVATPEDATQETDASSGQSYQGKALIPGDYRVVFAVITTSAVLVYDTQHPYPLARVGGLHLAPINDATWSRDGRLLTICSSDGYVTFIRFAKGALGVPLEAEKVPLAVKNAQPYLHGYTPPPYVEPERKSKADAKAAPAVTAAPTQEKAAEPTATVSNSSSSSSGSNSISNGSSSSSSNSDRGAVDPPPKKRRITPVAVTSSSSSSASSSVTPLPKENALNGAAASAA